MGFNENENEIKIGTAVLKSAKKQKDSGSLKDRTKEERSKLSEKEKLAILQNLKGQLKRKPSKTSEFGQSKVSSTELTFDNLLGASPLLKPSLNIGNLENLPRRDYNDEFREVYDELSPSWRAGVDEMI